MYPSKNDLTDACSIASNGRNFHTVRIGDLTLWFSYHTLIGFESPQTGKHVIANLWSSTSGLHLNWIEPDKSKREDLQQYMVSVRNLLGDHFLIAIPTAPLPHP